MSRHFCYTVHVREEDLLPFQGGHVEGVELRRYWFGQRVFLRCLSRVVRTSVKGNM